MAHQVAFLYNKEKGTLTRVQANNLEDRDRYKDFRCVLSFVRIRTARISIIISFGIPLRWITNTSSAIFFDPQELCESSAI